MSSETLLYAGTKKLLDELRQNASDGLLHVWTTWDAERDVDDGDCAAVRTV